MLDIRERAKRSGQGVADGAGRDRGVLPMTGQKQKRKTVQNILYVLALMVAVIILFYLYTEANNQRIEEQNRTYARDSAWQMMSHVEGEFANAKNRINTYAYFFGESLESPEVSAEALNDMAKNSLFDAFCFTDRDGFTLTADGKVIDSRDREYYRAGMKGEGGIFAIHRSRLNGEATVSFYTPLYYEGEILGVFHGIYSARQYLKDILDITFFGQSADVYLCTQDGTVLATSDGEPYIGYPLADLHSAKVIDEKMWKEAAEVFATAGRVYLRLYAQPTLGQHLRGPPGGERVHPAPGLPQERDPKHAGERQPRRYVPGGGADRGLHHLYHHPGAPRQAGKVAAVQGKPGDGLCHRGRDDPFFPVHHGGL